MKVTEQEPKVRLIKCLCGKARQVTVMVGREESRKEKNEIGRMVAAGCEVSTISLEVARKLDFCFDCKLY